MRIKNFKEVTLKLQLHLNDYLRDQGIDSSRSFRCINPEHEDSNPSCSTSFGDNTVFHCLGCKTAGNIFKAAFFLEGRPLVGQPFITETLLPLAKKYNISIEAAPLTEEEIYELDTYRAYDFASQYFLSHPGEPFYKEAITSRGWSLETCKLFGIGCCPTFKDFREYMKSIGFTASFLDDIDLGRRELFDAGNLIFTVRDEAGRPVGFASRNLNYTEDKLNGSKYINQRTTGVKCNIYKKGSRLYGFDILLKRNLKKNTPIYIQEGYPDVVSSVQAGLVNTVGLGGISLSIDQLQLIKDHGFSNIILCLDGDSAGQKRTSEILDSVLGGHKDIKIWILSIPEGKDPDDFIRQEGIQAFKKLRKWSAFEWRLSKFSESDTPETICQAMIPLIVNEGSSVIREQMEKALALQTGFSQKAIHSDVERYINSKEAEKIKERENILFKLKRVIEKDPSSAEFAIKEADSALFELSKKFDEDILSEQSFLSEIDFIKTKEEKKDGTFSGMLLSEDLQPFQEALCGNWKGAWFCIGGKENTGKSSFLMKLLLTIAREPKNNAVCIYHSIDDSFEQLFPKAITVLDGERNITLNEVADPNYWINVRGSPESIRTYRERAYEKILDLAKNGRFILKDANAGSSLAYADSIIQYFSEKYPDRHIIYCLDNFHKCQDFQEFSNKDERIRFKAISSMIKNLAVKHNSTVISSVEYTKLEKGVRPSNNNIAETGQIQYDANVICHFYNDMHEYGDKSDHYHLVTDRNNNVLRMPKISIDFGKNKLSSFKGRQWYNFYPDFSDFISSPTEENEEKEKQKKSGNSAIKIF